MACPRSSANRATGWGNFSKGHIDGYDQEPWRFGERYEAIIRKYHRRYQGETAISVDAPLETVSMFVRAGAIIPMGPALNYVGEKPVDPITFTNQDRLNRPEDHLL
ncbi:MAG TPA: hypothetical protein VES69_03445 [Pyrinomonadaceae bacterium]|nr:hypothetical protein [Pyrinomonadaceae bacterium]